MIFTLLAVAPMLFALVAALLGIVLAGVVSRRSEAPCEASAAPWALALDAALEAAATVASIDAGWDDAAELAAIDAGWECPQRAPRRMARRMRPVAAPPSLGARHPGLRGLEAPAWGHATPISRGLGAPGADVGWGRGPPGYM